MLWALVSPLRHTSEPPRFPPGHPIRRIFEEHGATIARNPVLTIIIAITISAILSFPTAFLYFHDTPGLSSVTHNVWTSATPYNYPGAEPDMGIKQAWIQGSYMDALTPEVLREGLRIQQALLGPDASCQSVDGNIYSGDSLLPADRPNQGSFPAFLKEKASFFHSPFLYWNCSLEALENDSDILRTVNENVGQRSSANVGLRWGSVFAGKHISHQKLVAADALVISMFYHLNSSAGAAWDYRAAELAAESRRHNKYQVYPHNGQESNATLFEFRYEPMTLWEKAVLTGCYLCAAIYLLVSLKRFRAVKSRLGLMFTVLTQICASVMSSFTILALFRVPVSHVPSWIFPFVIIVIGLQNMFRLINAVLATPPEQSSTTRIATALGEVGFISSVEVLTNLGFLILIGLASLPAIREFCVFACVALIIDFVLHMSFFLAVLSVDVRRLELQDSLDRMNMSNNDDDGLGLPTKKQNGYIDFIFRGGSPLSTRIAGSAIMICFAIALNMHFLDNQHPLVTLGIIGSMVRDPQMIGKRSLAQVPEMPLNVVRSPSAWMRLQDQLTGMELIRAVKPGDVRIVARAFNPIFFVMNGADRARTFGKLPNVLNTMEFDIIKDHIQSFMLSIVIVVACVTLLMNHLLLKDIPLEDPVETRKGEGPLLTTQTLIEGHSLDVVLMTPSPCGVLATVGLDRRIVVWKLNGNRQLCSKQIIRPACVEHVLWPVLAVAIDRKGKWLAVATKSGNVSFFKLEDGTCVRSVKLDLLGKTPPAFFFSPKTDGAHGPQLVTLRSDGWLAETYVNTAETYYHPICDGIVVSSSHGVFTPRLPLRIVTACQRGRIFVTAKSSGDWYTDQLCLTAPPLTSPIIEPGEPCTILPLSALGMIVSSRSCNVELVDLLSGSIIRSFQTGQFKPSTLRAFHAKRRTCLYCGCPSVLSFSIAYTERESGMFMMHTFTSSRGSLRDICLRAERDRRERKCTGFESVKESIHWLENVEGWEPTNLNMVAGIRRKESVSEEPSSDDYDLTPSCSSSLRRRKKIDRKIPVEDEDEWEAWTMDFNGTVSSYSLHDVAEKDTLDDRLMVGHVGPVSKIGQQSVAVGFGNTVKVLYIGNERFEDEDYTDPYQSLGRKNRMHRRC